MKGAFHIHTNYSNDSDCSLEQLTIKARELEYDFLIVTDHFEDIEEPPQQQRLIDDCRRLTSTMNANGPKLIPGVEIRFEDKAHILVIGLQIPIDPSYSYDIESLKYAARAQGALIGVAHLSFKNNLSQEELNCFDFVEAWNIRHDMKLPSPKHLKLAQKLPNSCIVGGLDLHSINDLDSIWLETSGNNILEAIKQKNIYSKSTLVTLDSDGRIVENNISYYLLYFPWFCIKAFAILIKKVFIKMRWRPPGILKRIHKRLVG